MTKFHLQIVTPDGLIFDDEATRVNVRAVDGEIGILANHIDFVTALGMGRAEVANDDQVRTAACIGGMLTVHNGSVKIVATTFEWSEDIDVERADRAYNKAKTVIDDPATSARDLKIAEAKLKRAIVRKASASNQ